MALTERPKIAPGCHPVQTGRYEIDTNAIEDLGETLLHWIRLRTPGGIVTGRPRLGKTRAVQYLSQLIPQILQDRIPMYLVSCKTYRIASENAFYTDLLLDLGHAQPTGQTSMKRDRICKFLIAAGQESNQKRVILILDDAQFWELVQLQWLMDIHNQLDKHQINLTVFLVGQPELLAKKQTLIAQNAQQIVGRFMVHEHKFYGCRTVEDVNSCLTSYDQDTEYPLDSRWSYTRYFFPDEFERGFRLANYAEDLWEVFEYAHTEAGIGSNVEIPMQYLTATVQYALTTFGVDGPAYVRQITKKHWKEAVEQSGYVMGEKIRF